MQKQNKNFGDEISLSVFSLLFLECSQFFEKPINLNVNKTLKMHLLEDVSRGFIKQNYNSLLYTFYLVKVIFLLHIQIQS